MANGSTGDSSPSLSEGKVKKGGSMGKLSYGARKKLKKSSFVFPGKKTKKNPAGKGGYPIPDASHARNALARVSQFGSPAQKAAVRSKVHAKYPGIGRKAKSPKPLSSYFGR